MRQKTASDLQAILEQSHRICGKKMIADGTMHVPSGQDYNSSEACRNAFAGGTAAMIQQQQCSVKGIREDL